MPQQGATDPSTAQRAIVQTRYGHPTDVLTMTTIAITPPTGTQVQVRVHAAALNPIDWQMIEGNRRRITSRSFPFVPLFDLAGTVVAVGDQVTRCSVGDQVHADNQRDGGGLSEYVDVEQDLLSARPASLSFAEAAALPLAAQTALAVLDRAGAGPGSRVAVIGASGGVGAFVVQMAKALGSEHVVGICSARNQDLVRALGADETIDHRMSSLSRAVPARSLDVVIDCVGGREQWLQARTVLRDGGRFVTIARDEDGAVTLRSTVRLLRRVAGRKIRSLAGRRIRYLLVFLDASSTLLDRVDRMVEAGQVRVHLGARIPFDLEDVVELMQRSRGESRWVV